MSFVARETDDEFSILEYQLRKSVECKHEDATREYCTALGDNQEYEHWHCLSCNKTWEVWPEEGA